MYFLSLNVVSDLHVSNSADPQEFISLHKKSCQPLNSHILTSTKNRCNNLEIGVLLMQVFFCIISASFGQDI